MIIHARLINYQLAIKARRTAAAAEIIAAQMNYSLEGIRL
jgi:hypothetical protein